MASPAPAKADRPSRMLLPEALAVLRDLRQDQVVLTTMAMAREWNHLSQGPLDLHHVPAAMGHTASLGLGLALARPEREVIVLNGDGSLLMNLGVLVTIAAAGAANFSMIVADNGVYEVTGNQQTPAEAGQCVAFAALARASGFPTAAAIDDLATWRQSAAEILRMPGPRFISLSVEPDRENFRLPVPRDMPQRVARLKEKLCS
jgi:thiamine pyrophosphate-dependent acetolactate synthase large subunit-like protein